MPFCRSVQLTDLTRLGPTCIVGSWSRHTLASVSPRAFKARETCCWSGSYSILHCRNVSVLPKKLIVCDWDDSGPRVTTFAQLVSTSQQTQCMLPPLTSAHHEKIVTVHQNVGLQAFVEEVARRSHASGKSSRLQNLSIMFSPTLSSIQGSVHRLSQFPAHAWLLCLDPRLAIGRRRRELHLRRSGLDSRLQWRSGKVLNYKHVSLTRNIE